MKVNYYGIHSCEYILNEDKTLIAAPLGVKIQAVQQLGFYKAEDGRWYKELSPDEALFFHSMRNMDVVDFPENTSTNKHDIFNQNDMSPADKKKAYILYVIALFLIFGVGLLSYLLSKNFGIITFPVVASSFIVGIILMIYVNIRYPKNNVRKLFDVINIISEVIMIMFIISFFLLTKSCSGCLW